MEDDYILIPINDTYVNEEYDNCDRGNYTDEIIISNINDIFSLDDVTKEQILEKSKEENNILCIFEFKQYVLDIWNSYGKNKNSIWKQFYVDFNRQDIFIGNIKCCEISDFVEYIKPLKQNIYMGFACHTLASMLCNQSSFCVPFQLMFKLYQSESSVVVSRSNTHSDRTTISLNICDHYMTFTLTTCLYIVDIDTTNTESVIKLEINIDIPRFYEPRDTAIGIIKWTIDHQN